MLMQKKPIPKKPMLPKAPQFDLSVGYKANPNYNIFDKTTQNVYSNQYTTGNDGFINFAGGVRMDGTGIAQNDIDGLSKFYADSANERNLFHEKQYDSINEAKRVKEQGVSWGNWEGMGNSERLSVFNKMYGNSAPGSYNMLDGSELRGNGDGGKLSAINVALDNPGGGQTSFDPRDSQTFYGALNKGATFGSQPKIPKISSMFGVPKEKQTQTPSVFNSFSNNRNKQMQPQQPQQSAISSGMRSLSMPMPKRNLIPRPKNPGYNAF